MSTRIVRTIRASVTERGATAVEYALMVAMIALVIITAVMLLGDNLSQFFNDAANSI